MLSVFSYNSNHENAMSVPLLKGINCNGNANDNYVHTAFHGHDLALCNINKNGHQTTIPNVCLFFFEMEMCYILSKISLKRVFDDMIDGNSTLFKVVVWLKAIISTNVDQDLWRHMASLGHNELTRLGLWLFLCAPFWAQGQMQESISVVVYCSAYHLI